jgi:hypothetical protein
LLKRNYICNPIRRQMQQCTEVDWAATADMLRLIWQRRLKYVEADNMVRVAQLARASVCGTEGRGFEPHFSPGEKQAPCLLFFIFTGTYGTDFTRRNREADAESYLDS